MIDPLKRHGHVQPHPYGVKARCGGPPLCADCADEQRELDAQRDVAFGWVVLDDYYPVVWCGAALGRTMRQRDAVRALVDSAWKAEPRVRA